MPDTAFKLALDRLRNSVANTADPARTAATDLAYALYVLARNGMAPIGDLRYLADARLDDLGTPIAKAQIAAALAMVGDRTRAERVYAAALAALAPPPQHDCGRADYGSTLRDAAALRHAGGEGGAQRATVQAAVQRVEAARAACVRPPPRRMRGCCSRQARWRRTRQDIARRRRGGDQEAALPHHPAASLKEPLRITNNGDAT